MKIAYKNIKGLTFKNLFSGAFIALALTSCTEDPNSPGIEFMPDMYRAVPYEAYLKETDLDSTEFFERNFEKLGIDYNSLDSAGKAAASAEVSAIWDVFKSGSVNGAPVKGTVAQGQKPFAISKDDRSAAKSVEMPLDYSEANVKEGKAYFEIFCTHCHGAKGAGDGKMVTLEVYPVQPPNFASGPAKDLSAGEIYHTIYYGKGMMGSHAAQISEDKRWKIVQYVQTLQGNKLESLASTK